MITRTTIIMIAVVWCICTFLIGYELGKHDERVDRNKVIEFFVDRGTFHEQMATKWYNRWEACSTVKETI